MCTLCAPGDQRVSRRWVDLPRGGFEISFDNLEFAKPIYAEAPICGNALGLFAGGSACSPSRVGDERAFPVHTPSRLKCGRVSSFRDNTPMHWGAPSQALTYRRYRRHVSVAGPRAYKIGATCAASCLVRGRPNQNLSLSNLLQNKLQDETSARGQMPPRGIN